MRINAAAVFILAALAVFTGCGQKKQEVKVIGPAEQYITKVIACLDNTESILPGMKAAADDAASRWASGGHVYVTDDETINRTGKEEVKEIPGGGFNYPMSEDWGGFVAEACDRAGGFRHIQPVPIEGTITKKDVILAGTLELNADAQVEQLKKLKASGALIIVFGSKSSKAAAVADFLIDNGLEAGTVPAMTVAEGKTIGPVAPMANVINLWTFSSELIGAMNRLGKMPTLWQSMFMPGAAPRNMRIAEMEFDTAVKVQAVEPGALGRQFIAAARADLDSIKARELDKFDQAGKLCAETLNAKRKVVTTLIGHFMVDQTRMPGYPALFTVKANLYGKDYLQGSMAKDDVYLHVGYSYAPVDELTVARESGAKTIAVFTPGPNKVGEGTPITPDMSMVDIYIDPFWKHGDSVVEVPGYDVKVMPVSGVVMVTCYWMILGETVKNMTPAK